jgi:hypothetical protein
VVATSDSSVANELDMVNHNSTKADILDQKFTSKMTILV